MSGHAVWQWKLDLDKHGNESWTDYSFADATKIEKAHAKGEESLVLNKNYSIDFKEMIQFQTSDRYRQRPIRRIKDKVQWFWKDDNGWKEYSSKDTEKIEYAYNQDKKNEKFALNKTYCIHFPNMIQFRKEDYDRQRPIKRTASEAEKGLPLTPSKKKKAANDDDAGPAKKAKKQGDGNQEVQDLLQLRKLVAKVEEKDDGEDENQVAKNLMKKLKDAIVAHAAKYSDYMDPEEMFNDEDGELEIDYDNIYQCTEERLEELGHNVEDEED
eukprot:m.30658 g.30658  ORF g.30658 m.30658 type:complete len:270 (-) comp8224_c0_seq1:32-841(-)